MDTIHTRIPDDQAYELMNTGGIVLLCTKGQDRYDLAPIAWTCPLDYTPVSKILLVCDVAHRTLEDLRASGEFAVALPAASQRDLVERTGSVSGREADKYASLGLAANRAVSVDVLIPDGVAAWLECRLIHVYMEGTSAIVTGEVIAAFAIPEAWKERLHYVSEGIWYAPGVTIP